MKFSLLPLVRLLFILVQFLEECDATKTMQQYLDDYKGDDHIVNKENFLWLVRNLAFTDRGNGCYDVNKSDKLDSIIRQHPKQPKPIPKPIALGGLNWSKKPQAPPLYPDPDPARAAQGYKVVKESDWKKYKKEVARREEADAKMKWQDWKRKNRESNRGQSIKAREKRQRAEEEQRLAAIGARKAARKKRFAKMLSEAKTSVWYKNVEKKGLVKAPATVSAPGGGEAAIGGLKDVTEKEPGPVSAPTTGSAPADIEAATSRSKDATEEGPGPVSAPTTGSAPTRSLEANVIRGYNAARHYDDARRVRDLDDEWRINHSGGIEVA